MNHSKLAGFDDVIDFSMWCCRNSAGEAITGRLASLACIALTAACSRCHHLNKKRIIIIWSHDRMVYFCQATYGCAYVIDHRHWWTPLAECSRHRVLDFDWHPEHRMLLESRRRWAREYCLINQVNRNCLKHRLRLMKFRLIRWLHPGFLCWSHLRIGNGLIGCCSEWILEYSK